MTPTREDLSARAKALPREAKDALFDKWPIGVPGLGAEGYQHTPTELEKIEQAIDDVTQAPFRDPVPVDKERAAELTEKIKSLPSDLYERVTREGVDANVPNLSSPVLTDDHLDTLDGLLKHALGMHFSRIVGMGQAVAALEHEDGTALLEALCAFVAGPSQRDPNRLTHDQARDVEAATRLIAHDYLTVTETNGGKPQVSWNVDWKAEAKKRGVTQADLLVWAKGTAEKLDLPRPKNLPEARPSVVYEMLLSEGERPEPENPELQEDRIWTKANEYAGTQPVPDVAGREPKPDEILGIVEEVRRLPGARAARVVLRVPVELVERIPDQLYVRRVV